MGIGDGGLCGVWTRGFMSSKYNHSRKRTLPARVIKPATASNIDTTMIDTWSEQNPAREEKIWQKSLYKRWI